MQGSMVLFTPGPSLPGHDRVLPLTSSIIPLDPLSIHYLTTSALLHPHWPAYIPLVLSAPLTTTFMVPPLC